MKIKTGFTGLVLAVLFPIMAFAVAPVALNQSEAVVAGAETEFYLALTDVDTGIYSSQMVVTVVSAPLHGSIQSYAQRYSYSGMNNYYYYQSDSNFIGIDSFSWQAYDGMASSGMATVSVSVVSNTIPVAMGTTNSFSAGSVNNYVSLNYTHPDADSAQLMSYFLVTAPTNGTVTTPLYNSGWRYTPDPNFLGTVQFIWFCNDGVGDSGVATNVIKVVPVAPVPQNQSVCAAKNTALDITPSYAGGMGYSLNPVKVTNPSPTWGSVAVVGGKFRYTPPLNYLGQISFTWCMAYSNDASPVMNSSTATCSVTVMERGSGDWPMWRKDEFRTGGLTPNTLPDTLYLQWRRDLPIPSPAWRANSTMDMYSTGPYAEFDMGYEPVALGKTVFLGLNSTDCLLAMNTDTGVEQWRFYAEAPIRFAPVAVSNSVYVVSDDGKMYSLNATNGSVRWTFNGAPTNRKVFGHKRLVSNWPVRGGLVYSGGQLYFSAGLYATEGVFVYCVDAVTGAEIWRNDRVSGYVGASPHDAKSISLGMAPHGYLTVNTAKTALYLPTANNVPASLPLATGVTSNDTRVMYATRGWWADGGGNGNTAPTPQLVSGAKTYNAADVTALGVVGTVHTIIMADSKLLVTTRQGSLYCFGGVSNALPLVYAITNTPLVATNDVWTGLVSNLLAATSSYEGCGLVLGIGSGRLVTELLLQTTNLHVVAIDPDPVKVDLLRSQLASAGLYGRRCSTLVGDPTQCGLPSYVGRVIVSEDLAALGFPALAAEQAGKAFAGRLYECLRPYGGVLWLPTDSGQHAALAGWISSAAVVNATITWSGGYSQVRRVGALPGASNYQGYSLYGPDKAVRAPLGVQWFDSDDFTSVNTSIANGRIVAKNKDVYTGLPMTYDVSAATYPATNVVRSVSRVNPVYKVVETRTTARLYGCGADINYGNIKSMRSSSVAFYDFLADSGAVHLPSGRPKSYQYPFTGGNCDGGLDLIPANGVLASRSGYCYGCDFPLQSSFGLVHRTDVENWAEFRSQRSKRLVEDQPVRRLGVNFGAPGDRMDDTGTLWLHRPKRSSNTPMFGVTINGVDSRSIPEGSGVFASAVPGTTNYYHHASRIVSGTDKPWVAASGILGATNISVGLTPEAVVALPAAGAPLIDGVLNDACWNGLASLYMSDYTDIGYYLSKSGKLDSGSMVRYDSANLYVACRATGAVVADTAWTIVLSDRAHAASLSMLLSVKGDGTVTVPANTLAASTITGGGLKAEFSIPFSVLIAAGFDTNSLVFNVSHYSGAGLNWSDFRTPGEGIGANGSASSVPPLSGQFAPLSFDVPYGDMNQNRTYTVKLHFAETEGAAAGQRVFDVKLQGQTVLTNFDIASAAGGANRAVVKRFTGITAKDQMKVELVPVSGIPMISGLEFVEGGDGGTNEPVARNQTITVPSNKETSFTLAATDVDGDSLTYRIVSRTAHGVLWNQEPRSSASYLPVTGFTGTDTFSFVANDGFADSAPATVTLIVTPFDSALAAYWRMDETADSLAVARDSTGNGNDGNVNMGSSWVPGCWNSALSLDGASGYVDVGSKLNPDTNSVTLSCWFRWNGKAGDTMILDKGAFAYRVSVSNGYFRVAGIPSGAYWNEGTNFPVSPGKWTHAAVVYDKAQRCVYRNGSLVFSKSLTGNITTNSGSLMLGNSATPSATSAFGGELDEVRIYTRALSAGEISALALPGIVMLNQAGPVSPLGMRVGATNTFWASVTGAGGSPVSYSWWLDGLPVANATNTSYVYVPSTNQIGPRLLRMLATDQTGSSVSNDWAVTVSPANANQIPVISNTLPASPLSLYSRLAQSFSATVSDADMDPMTYAWALDGVLQAGQTNASFSWTPPDAAVGAHTVRFTVVDSLGGLATNDWAVTVALIPNTSPVISGASPVSPTTVMCWNSQLFSVTAGDPEGDSLTYAWRLDGSVQPGQTGASFTYSPLVANAGLHALNVQVMDGRGGYATNSWSVIASNKPSLKVSASGAGGAYTSIVAALAAATSGDIITVEDAVLTEKNVTITKSVTIAGHGASNTIVQADAGRRSASNRIFTVNSGVIVTIRDMTLRNGHASGATLGGGGAIKNGGTLTVNDCTLTANDQDGTAVSYQYGGGAILGADGNCTTSVYRCSFSDNTASSHGGAIFHNRPAFVQDCTFERNVASGSGGAIKDYYGRGSTYIQCTFSSNNAAGGAACQINDAGSLMAGTISSLIANCTFHGNRATNSGAYGGAIWTKTATNAFAIVSCLFAGNVAANGADVYTGNAGKASLSNCYSEGTVGGVWASVYASQTNKGAGSSKLDTVLSSNGGVAKTHALLVGSPAIDAGQNPWAMANDQRGTGYARVTGSAPDIGAFEYGSSPAPATATNGVPVSWLQAFGFTNNWDAAALSDLDGDGALTWQEWIAGTCPTSWNSRLELRPSGRDGDGFHLIVDSVSGRVYGVVFKANLTDALWIDFTNGLQGSGGVLNICDPVPGTQRFYRITVGLP